MPPWSSLRAVTGAVLMCSADGDVRRGCHPCCILCPLGAMCRLQTEMLLLESCCQHVSKLHGPAGSSGRVATAVANLDFSGINSFLHSLWPRSPSLPATDLLNTYEPHKADFNLSQKPSRWMDGYLSLNIQWASGKITKYGQHTFFQSNFHPTILQRAVGTAFSPVQLKATYFQLNADWCHRVRAQGPSPIRSPRASLGSCESIKVLWCSWGSLTMNLLV